MSNLIFSIDDREEEVYKFSNFDLIIYTDKSADIMTENDCYFYRTIEDIKIVKSEINYGLATKEGIFSLSHEDYEKLENLIKEKNVS